MGIKAEKCEFYSQSVSFLGFVIQAGQIKAVPKKVRAVVEWPWPTTRQQLQQFSGFANFYQRFIMNYIRLVLPLTQLTSTHKDFEWSPRAEEAFKNRFPTAPILVRPDPSRQFVVEVDSGLGTVPSQGRRMGSCIPAPFSLNASPQPNRTMTWVTGSYWRLS